MQIVMPSEASQMFHILRRQALRSYRKPLVIFMSKRLLRFKDSISPLSNFTEGSTFRPVIGDVAERADNGSVKRVVLCAGQVYYDLAKARDERNLADDVAIVRVEQLYPFPYDEIKAELAKIPECQRSNMGAGGAAQSGCVLPNPPPHRARVGCFANPLVCRPPDQRFACCRLYEQTRCPAQAADRRCADLKLNTKAV